MKTNRIWKLGIISSFAISRIEALDSSYNGGDGRQRKAIDVAVPIEEPTFSPVDIQIPLGFADEQTQPMAASPKESLSNTDTMEPTTAKSENQSSVTVQIEQAPSEVHTSEQTTNTSHSESPNHNSTWCPTYFSGNGNACGDLPTGASWIQCAYSELNRLQTCTCTKDDPFWKCESNAPNSDEFGTDSIASTEDSVTNSSSDGESPEESEEKSSVGAYNVTSSADSTRNDGESSASTSSDSQNISQPSSKVSDESSSKLPDDSTGDENVTNATPPVDSNTDFIDEKDSFTQSLSGLSPSMPPASSTYTDKVTNPLPTPNSDEVDVDETESPSLAPDVDIDDTSSNPSPSSSSNGEQKSEKNFAPTSTPIDWPSLLPPTPKEEIGSPALVPSAPPSSSGMTFSQKLPPDMFVKRTSPPVPTETSTRLPTFEKGSNGDNVTDTSACRNASLEDRRSIIFKYISTLSSKEAIDDREHPAFMAGSWIADEDLRKVCPGDPNFTQRYVLALLYFYTFGDDWLRCTRNSTTECPNKSFLSDFNECNWGGVTCDSQQRVTNLNLDENNMKGSIPQELRYLEYLNELDLDSNDLIGHFPTWVGTMRYLEKLDLDRNILSGPIPEDLYSSTTLKYVDMDRNILSGTISSNIGRMSQLVFFQADFNQLIGTIPTEIANIVDLQYFSIFGNGFDKSAGIPFEICGLHVQIYADCKMCEKVGDCCTVCLPEDLSHEFY